GIGSLEGRSSNAARRSARKADSSQISANLMYASRELSFAALYAHSKDSSAHARYSAAVIIFISRSPRLPRLTLSIAADHRAWKLHQARIGRVAGRSRALRQCTRCAPI